MCRADEITIRTGTGATRHRETHVGSARVSEAQICPVGLPLPSSFLEPIADLPAALDAVLYVTVLGPERTVVVPVGGGPVAVPGGSICVADIQQRPTEEGFRDFTWIECRTAFRESATLVRWQGAALSGLSLSPWPATLRLAPVDGRRSYQPGTFQEVPLAVREPITHIRTSVTAENIRLRDFEFRP